MNNTFVFIIFVVLVNLIVFVKFELHLQNNLTSKKTNSSLHYDTHLPEDFCPNFGRRWSIAVTEKAKVPAESHPFIPFTIYPPIVQYIPESPVELFDAYKDWDSWHLNGSEFITISKLSRFTFLLLDYHTRVGQIKRFVHASNICFTGRKALYLTKHRHNISPPVRVWSGIFGNAYATLDDVANFTWYALSC